MADSLDGNCIVKMNSESKEDNTENGINNGITPAKVAYMPVQKYDLYYKMDHKRRGLAFIFNHQKFEECPERHGTKEDANLLTRTLENLNFEVNVFTDLYHREIMDQVDKAARFDHSNYDCFLLVVLTHGNDNLLWAKDKAYLPQEIFDKFTADMCPTLAGKPKIFILQACQGTGFDPGITLVERTETDGGGSRRRYQIPVRADFLIIYASFRGYYAFRNNVEGSYFISTLCQELAIRGTSENILVILTLVNQRVAVEFVSRTNSTDTNDKKQMPYFHCSLTRLLQFTKRIV